jgi:hypothetical protein
MNGNSLVGPGGGNVFTDEAGQDYYLYHAVTLTAPYYTGFAGATQRPAAFDAIDWINGWPVARGAFGPSDAASPQPKPSAQPGATDSYTTTLNANDEPLTAITAVSDEFNGTALSSQWTILHSMPSYTLTGSALRIPGKRNFRSGDGMDQNRKAYRRWKRFVHRLFQHRWNKLAAWRDVDSQPRQCCFDRHLCWQSCRL